jgi:Tol biopolymer transport system component
MPGMPLVYKILFESRLALLSCATRWNSVVLFEQKSMHHLRLFVERFVTSKASHLIAWRVVYVWMAYLVVSTAHAAEPVKVSGSMQPLGDVNVGVISTPTNPSNARAVFVADRVTDGVDELWSVPLTGGVPTNLTGPLVQNGDLQYFEVSKDGNWVAFAANKDVVNAFELYVVPTAGGIPVKLSGATVAGGNVMATGFAFSPDSTRVLFLADKDTDNVLALYSAPLTGGEPVKLSGALVTGESVLDFSISPDSTRVVFGAKSNGSNALELFSTPIAGGAITNLSGPMVSGGNVGNFEISADSARVVFRADKEIDGVFELYSVPISGGTPLKISGALATGENVGAFFISPDATRVVFHVRKDAPSVTELVSVAITGGLLSNLSGPLTAGARVTMFFISPNSTRVVFLADKDTVGIPELYSASIFGGLPVKLFGTLIQGANVGLQAFTITPDSTRVVVRANTDSANVAELYSVGISGGTPVNLSGPLPSGGNVYFFAISPDSARAVFRADKGRTGVSELYSVPVTGGSPTKISGSMVQGGDVSTFSISADSAQVVFRADKEVNDVVELFSASITGGGSILDIDGDGQVLATTDLLMLTRWNLGIRGAGLFGGITFSGSATRTTAAAIEDHLRRLTETGLAW